MIVKIKVKTSQPNFSIQKKTENQWIVALTSKPTYNQANIELIKELAKLGFQTRIIRGAKSKEKTIELLN